MSVAYVLNANKNGKFSVAWTVSDGSLNATGELSSVSIAAVNDAPTLQSRARVATMFNLDKNDSFVAVDVELDSTSFSLLSAPAAAVGQLTLLDGGGYTFSPAGAGTTSTTIRISDSEGGTTDVVVAIVVLDPQPSCFHIIAQDAAKAVGAAGSGVYPLLTAGVSYDAFCDMADRGGGWTLTMKADGNTNVWDYGNNLWSDANLVAEDAATSSDLVVGPGNGSSGEAKLQSYLSVKVDELRVGLALSTTAVTAFTFVPGNLVLAVNPSGPAATSMRVLMGDLNQAPINLDPPTKAAWLSIGTGFTLQANCNLRGLNQQASGSGTAGLRRVRIGFLANEGNDCNSPDSFVGIGTNVSNKAVGNKELTVDRLRHGAVLVRSNDLTDLTTQASCAAHAALGFVGDAFYLVGGVRTFCDQP